MNLLKVKNKLLSADFIKYYAYAFLVFEFFLVSFYLNYLINLKMNGWVLGDWLINYQDGGFKRRGLSGYIFLKLAFLFNIKLNYLVFLFVEFLWAYFLFKLFVFFKDSKSDVSGFLFLLMLPIGLLFNVTSLAALGRKEILLLVLFSYYISEILKKNKYVDIVVPFLLFIITFFHEITFFYVGYFLLIKWINNDKNYITYLFYFLAVFIPSVLFYFFGKPINLGMSEIYFKNLGVVLSPGIFNYHENFNIKTYYLKYYVEYLEYLLPIFVAFFAIVWFTRIYGLEYIKLNKFFFCIFVLSIPLFYLATDWGRWINIHMLMIIMVFFYKNLKNKNEVYISENEKLLLFIFIFINLFWQMDLYENGIKPNYFLEILLSKF